MRAAIPAVLCAALLASTGATAQDSQQPPAGEQMPGAMMDHGMMGQDMLGQDMLGQDMLSLGHGMMGGGMHGYGMHGDAVHGHGMRGHGIGFGMMDGSMMPMMGMTDLMPRIEGRLAYTKAALEITDAQSAPWNAYADAVRANAERMGKMMSSMMGMMHGRADGGLSAPERLDAAERHVSAHLDMLTAIKGPTTQLYDVLSDKQKTLADRLLHPMGMGGMM